MARIVNAPFLRARPLRFENVAPSPLASRARDGAPYEPEAGERRGAAHASRRNGYLRRARARNPGEG